MPSNVGLALQFFIFPHNFDRDGPLLCIHNTETVVSILGGTTVSHTAIVKIWGNSPSVRLPAAIMKEASLNIDDAIDFVVEDGRIII